MTISPKFGGNQKFRRRNYVGGDTLCTSQCLIFYFPLFSPQPSASAFFTNLSHLTIISYDFSFCLDQYRVVSTTRNRKMVKKGILPKSSTDGRGVCCLGGRRIWSKRQVLHGKLGYHRRLWSRFGQDYQEADSLQLLGCQICINESINQTTGYAATMMRVGKEHRVYSFALVVTGCSTRKGLPWGSLFWKQSVLQVLVLGGFAKRVAEDLTSSIHLVWVKNDCRREVQVPILAVVSNRLEWISWYGKRGTAFLDVHIFSDPVHSQISA